VNFPGFFLGLVLATVGGAGMLLWMRLQGILKPQVEGDDFGFGPSPGAIVPGSPAEEEEFAYEGSIPLTTSVGHKMGSLAGIVVFVAVVGAAIAFALFLAGNVTIRTIEHFIQTSPSP
jgi:hypothetical protein